MGRSQASVSSGIDHDTRDSPDLPAAIDVNMHCLKVIDVKVLGWQ
jgi:hypothetical protein